MPRTLGIIAIKGGVGKTTISSALAADLANHFKKKVLLVDTNYSAPNLGLHMDILEPEKTIHHVLDKKIHIKSAIQEKFGVSVIPGDYVYNKQLNYLKLKDALNKIKNNYDFTILDSSPSLNEEILSTMLASDSLFVVTTPDYPTLSCSIKAAKLAKARGRPIHGIIINKVRDPRYEIKLREIENVIGIPVIAKIPDDKKTIRAMFTRIPLTIYNPRTKFSREINNLSAALSNAKPSRSIIKSIIPFNFRKEEINRELLKSAFYKRRFK